ncbi:MAG TPA: serine hydrolase domain-containing protein [Gemmatimonadales bacterium]|nr:serine hydrolase domain-containing protein [Gemmatimonadales bacterium]
MTRKSVAVLMVLLSVPTAGHAQTPAGLDAAWRSVASAWDALLDREGVVGGSLVLVRGDSVLGREHHGFADLATHRPTDDRTIYHWASITKTFTAISLMQLRDRGRLSLDDPVVKYVPELRMVHNPFGSMDGVTLRHLLSHSAGFRNPTWPWGGDQPWHPFEPTQWSQLVAMMPYTEVKTAPGTHYSYSNPGLIFVGRTIEALSGDDYEVYVDKNVLKPLGMLHSYFDLTPYHLLADRSNNYEVKDGKTVTNGLDFDTGITVSNGGLNAPLQDMVKYLAFLLGKGPGASGPVPVLARASLEEMWRPSLPTSGEASGDSIAISFFIRRVGDRRLIGHTGSQRGFRSFFYLDLATGTALIGVVNTAAADEGPGRHPDTALIISDILARAAKEVWPLFR